MPQKPMRVYLNVDISKRRRRLAGEASTNLVIRDNSYYHKQKKVWGVHSTSDTLLVSELYLLI